VGGRSTGSKYTAYMYKMSHNETHCFLKQQNKEDSWMGKGLGWEKVCQAFVPPPPPSEHMSQLSPPSCPPTLMGPRDVRRVRREGGKSRECHPACPHVFNKPQPWFYASLTLGFVSHFRWNAPFGQTTKKMPHYKLGNVEKENYLPKAVLNRCSRIFI
jgi:hypothetical protein